MFCTQCGFPIYAQDRFCGRCGTPVVALPHSPTAKASSALIPPLSPHRPTIDTPRFTGHGTDIFSADGLKAVSWMCSIVGAPIGLRYLFQWFTRHLSLGSGTTFMFTGTSRGLCGFLSAIAGVTFVQRILDRALELSGDEESLLLALLALALMLGGQAVGAFIQLRMLQWQCSNTRASSGVAISCVAPVAGFVGRELVVFLSIFTIIGWAWTTAWFARWLASHLRAEGRTVRFRGTGGQILWRSIVAVLASIPIVSIPWVIAWSYRWGVSQLEIEYSSSLARA
jgi:hypothetical protein